MHSGDGRIRAPPLLLPLWADLLRERGTRISVVIPIRNPLDVANSMARVWNLPHRQSLRLWLYYTLAIREAVRELPHVYIDYKSLLANGRGAVQLLNFLEIAPLQERLDQMASIVKPQLQHSQTSIANLQAFGCIGETVAGLYLDCIDPSQRAAPRTGIQNLDDYRRLACIANFDRCDIMAATLDSALICDYDEGTRGKYLLSQQLLFTPDHTFDETYRLPKPGVVNIRFQPCTNQLLNLKIEAIETDGIYRGIRKNNALRHDKGWDFFNPDMLPIYELDGDFRHATYVRIRGQIKVEQIQSGFFR